jgi:hypothetical protein
MADQTGPASTVLSADHKLVKTLVKTLGAAVATA